MERIGSGVLKKVYKKRYIWSHKYDFGHLLVIGGSKHYSGSPAFNALAALRAGVDLVTIVAPERAANIIASFAPDMIAYPLDGDYICPEHLDKLVEMTKNKDAVVIGGGLTRSKEVLKTVVEYLKRIDIPAVIDADAIHAVATKKEILKDKKFVLTPHPYEFFVFSGIKPTKNMKYRIKMVKDAATAAKTTILLKGHLDIISDGERASVNRTGNPYMTAGGLGDTLAGITGAILARGIGCFEAACAAAYINGKAGEIASKQFGESLIASDVINTISKVLKL